MNNINAMDFMRFKIFSSFEKLSIKEKRKFLDFELFNDFLEKNPIYTQLSEIFSQIDYKKIW